MHDCIKDETGHCFECDKDMRPAPPELIGLCGAAGAGKDSVAKMLQAAYGYRADSFAAPIYAALAAMFGVSVQALQDRELKEAPWPALLGHTPRHLLQTLGTEYGRDMIDRDIWLLLADQRRKATGRPTVISDVRFENEAAFIRKSGGLLIHVKRDTDQVHQHISESALDRDLAEITLDNDGTLHELRAQILGLFIRGKRDEY